MLAGMDQTGESQISLADPDSRAMASVTVFAVALEKMLGCSDGSALSRATTDRRWKRKRSVKGASH
jgi:hypothetical protein